MQIDQARLTAALDRTDAIAASGKARDAAAAYMQILQAAGGAGPLPAPVVERLHKARAYCERYSRDYEAHLQTALTDAGLAPAPDSAVARSLDIMLGRSQVYHQQPRMFYYPGLPQRQFYDPAEFEWVPALEAQTAAIAEEAARALSQASGFEPYLRSEAHLPHTEHTKLANSDDWGAYYLWRDGEIVEDHAAACPATMAALEKVPQCHVAGRLPSVLFSLLRPGTHIPPHTGMLNTRLICHLPLIVPEGCRFRVGSEIREWHAGKTLIFDDSIEHEAWNDSAEPRIVLLFDIWRPEIGETERDQIACLLSAITTFEEAHS